jgi:DNA-binding NarL/FixJ family response regulator
MALVQTSSIRVVLAGRAEFVDGLADALTDPPIRLVAVCTNRVEALAAIRGSSPDVCVVDRDLDGGGLIVAVAVASPRPAPKVLIVGDTDTPAEQRAARLAGAVAYLSSSVNPASFISAVIKAAGKPSS